MDNFYHSVPLTKALTSKKSYVCGTLRKNQNGNPEDAFNKRLKKGEMYWKRNDDIAECKWQDKGMF